MISVPISYRVNHQFTELCYGRADVNKVSEMPVLTVYKEDTRTSPFQSLDSRPTTSDIVEESVIILLGLA